MNKLVFNRETLQTWKEIDPDNWQKIALDILIVFLEAAKSQTQELFLALDKKDGPSTKVAAHKLKSSCGNVGADAAHFFLDELEKNALQLEATDFGKHRDEFRKLIDSTIKEAEIFESDLRSN